MRCPKPTDEDGAARRPRAVALVQAAQELTDVLPRVAVAAADGGRELVHHPRVAGATSKPASAMRWRASRRPRTTTRPVLATQRLQVVKWISASAWKFGPSARMRRRLLAPELRLVGDDRRNGDVVLGARRGRGSELRRQPQPVRRRIEDRTQRPARGAWALARGGSGWARDERLPELRRRGRLERRDRRVRSRPLSRRAETRAGGEADEDEQRGEAEARTHGGSP